MTPKQKEELFLLVIERICIFGVGSIFGWLLHSLIF